MNGGDGPVLLFDAECGLCNALVRLMLRRDRKGMLRFAPLQGDYGQRVLRRLGLPLTDFDSLVFLPRGEAGLGLVRTAGALAAMEILDGGWGRAARVFRRVPAGLRDAIYRLVARTRYLIFGRYRGLPLTESSEWRGRFL